MKRLWFAIALLLAAYPLTAHAFSSTFPFTAARPFIGAVVTNHPEIQMSTLDVPPGGGAGGQFVLAMPREATSSQISFEFRYTSINPQPDPAGSFAYHVCAGVVQPGQTLTQLGASCVPITTSTAGFQWLLQDERFGSVSIVPKYYNGSAFVPCTTAACNGGILIVGLVRLFSADDSTATMGFINLTVNFQ